MTQLSSIKTAEQLWAAGDIGRCELIRGQLVMMTPAGFDHGRVVMRISGPIFQFVEERDLGVVIGAETGFIIERDPDTVRAPDVAFVKKGRVPERTERGFYKGPPDLAVEVISPDDRPRDVADKTAQWLASGCGQVWLVDPRKRTVEIHVRGRDVIALVDGGAIDGGDVLPGFNLPVSAVLD